MLAATTLRRERRDDEWIEPGEMDALREMALEAYDRIVGLGFLDVAVDCAASLRPPAAARRRPAGAR